MLKKQHENYNDSQRQAIYTVECSFFGIWMASLCFFSGDLLSISPTHFLINGCVAPNVHRKYTHSASKNTFRIEKKKQSAIDTILLVKPWKLLWPFWPSKKGSKKIRKSRRLRMPIYDWSRVENRQSLCVQLRRADKMHRIYLFQLFFSFFGLFRMFEYFSHLFPTLLRLNSNPF